MASANTSIRTQSVEDLFVVVSDHADSVASAGHVLASPEPEPPEVIDIDADDTVYIHLERLGRTVKAEDAFTLIRFKYQKLFSRQATAICIGMKGGKDVQRVLQDIAPAVRSASIQHLIDRHGKEWRKAMNDAKRLFTREIEAAEDFFDSVHRPDECVSFNKVFLKKRLDRLRALKRDDDQRNELVLDLKDVQAALAEGAAGAGTA